jgi:ADP-ribose pyrophosphatase
MHFVFLAGKMVPAGIRKWEVLSREVITRKCRRDIERVIFRLPNGMEGEFYIKTEGPSAAVFAITRTNQVILAKQFRPGPNAILDELPGGAIEAGETPEQAGERELLEETGYRGRVEKVSEILDCAYSTMRRHCVIITECEKVAEQQLDESEFIEVVLMAPAEFRQHLRSGNLTDIEVGYLGLDHLNLL